MPRVLEMIHDCKLCGYPRRFRLHGLEGTLTPQIEADAKEWAKHFHWCDTHRLCAVCGGYVKSGENGDLDCAANDGSIRIHEDYTDHYLKVAQGDLGRHLIVHKECLPRTE